MKKKFFGLTMAVVMVVGLNIAALGTEGPPVPPEPLSIPICLNVGCS